ncbi:hypothetical protein PMG71_14585 [Roseofilum sp. BLCC_M154]|uniref:Uncharacterized protein n=1 Tax=Roseofilum acuticapitatum BLCC-M154 TaxID=3022444 RepID=A0ABT7AUR8_9CYAN|nr:hypothetical protein [Roseofilum acuticapitatum]MDJ1170656.1 hypothetical protein [Roseofilum acuticapitatum BLCC-M154]
MPQQLVRYAVANAPYWLFVGVRKLVRNPVSCWERSQGESKMGGDRVYDTYLGIGDRTS